MPIRRPPPLAQASLRASKLYEPAARAAGASCGDATMRALMEEAFGPPDGAPGPEEDGNRRQSLGAGSEPPPSPGMWANDDAVVCGGGAPPPGLGWARVDRRASREEVRTFTLAEEDAVFLDEAEEWTQTDAEKEARLQADEPEEEGWEQEVRRRAQQLTEGHVPYVSQFQRRHLSSAPLQSAAPSAAVEAALSAAQMQAALKASREDYAARRAQLRAAPAACAPAPAPPPMLASSQRRSSWYVAE